LGNDALRVVGPFDQSLWHHSRPGPGYYDLSEYLIGSVSLGVILLESNGQIDPNLENWTSTEIAKVRSEINDSVAWWSTQNPNASITFTIDFHICPTSYEPIIHPSACTDPTWQALWISDAMTGLGYTSGDYMKRTRDYINDIRENFGTDWTYTVFVVDSSADVDGYFSDGYCGYAYLGGPFVVMTYDNGPFGIDAMNQCFDHETAHIFWATDEYNGVTEYSGYLNASDVEGSGCLMYDVSLKLSSGTRQQIGWRDTDGDGLDDIIDTIPETILVPYTPDPSSNHILTYNGSAIDVAYPNLNPAPWDPGNDITINFIASVTYWVDGGTSQSAAAKDGAFDEYLEDYTFTTGSLSSGPHTITVVATNSVGNSDPTRAWDNVTVDTPPDNPTITGRTNGKAQVEYTYRVSAVDVDGDQVSFWIDWGDGNNSGWIGPVSSGNILTANHKWSTQGSYLIQVKAQDPALMESGWSTLQVSMPINGFVDHGFSFWEHHPFLARLYRILLGGWNQG
jgi:hypothetical protein